ncbi:XcbB/CpsF family capsular polysaccharide biosynthesis protein [Lactococcus petauri]|uniref:XcbB/CpsF family capsular polysaccharide biosynthesis protein n=2 Tax=Lactococcus TaxID=1357 RepID=UPI0024352D86|nr:XcbB/CpsF family capsular polysaccharide biosynthesis protein [Lactococcus petauri]MDG6136751.1 XcbB/CpsF family capsular polysaccharide biosynthesis protein [Lactococcus petauri]MDT2575326.1 XcbB/CpsF family capsular polysaccharide biosynthesis protein [Lactococcus petauri]MDT2594201.1 XcbB/CpsF family capsular polysaccharide biosynthesis protein [Lactococcus petauri]
MENRKKLLNVTYSKAIFDYDYEKIALDLKDKRNILELSKENSMVYEIYKDLLSHDYMFYFQSGTKSYFIKRKLIKNIWKRNDLMQYGDLFYTIEQPLENKIHSVTPMRLIVVFSSVTSENYYSPNIGIRCFTKNFSSIQKSVLKNTMVMRIMDLNLSHGSHYINTDNYPNFEEDVQESIIKVMLQYGIHKDNVVFYGASGGGTGALYHSLLGDYNSVCVDPVISLAEYNNTMGDKYFIKGLRKESILEDIEKLLNRDLCYKKIIIGSPAIPFNYRLYSKLIGEVIDIFDIFDESVKFTSDVSLGCILEQVTLINNYFLNSNDYKNKLSDIKNIYNELENIS